MDEAAKALAAEHIELVEVLARRLRRGKPHSVRAEDLLSAGLVGLCQAAMAFQQQRGVQFKSYATRRVVGAMLDELRGADWAPRSARRFEAVTEMVPFSAAFGDRACPASVASKEFDTADARDAVEYLLGGLSKRYADVVFLYAVMGYTFREVAEFLNISESRACQRYTLAMKMLREDVGRAQAASMV